MITPTKLLSVSMISFKVYFHLLEAICSPLGEFVQLKLVRVMEEEREDSVGVPFALRRMIGWEYHIGPEGALIGTGIHCTVCLPAESGIAKEHCLISWEEEEEKEEEEARTVRQRGGHFVLQDMTEGGGSLYLESSRTLETTLEEDQSDESSAIQTASTLPTPGGVFPLALTHGVRFVTGRIIWQLSALPPDLGAVAKAFYLAKNRKLAELMALVDSFDPPMMKLPLLAVTQEDEDGEGGDGRKLFFTPAALGRREGFDINAAYVPPSHKEEEHLFASFSPRRSVVRPSSLIPFSPRPSMDHTPQLLLHVAIDNGDLNMIKYLLEKGANVRFHALIIEISSEILK